MSHTIKTQEEILKKLGIPQLNKMQEEAQVAISSSSDTVLLSPTGTGKTLAFLLPLLAKLDPNNEEVQALIVAPSRELAIQIEQVLREMGSGYKTSVVYGGRLFSKDKIDLKHRPAVLVGTPGRISDHIQRDSFRTSFIKTLVLDEFDKSLEVGFEKEMTSICSSLPKLEKKILTSATQKVRIPKFVRLKNPVYVNYLKEVESQLEVRAIISPSKDKMETLVSALDHLGNQPGIIFCNFKESIQRVSEHLTDNNINHGCFFGGMEQKERERALIKFRNGTHQLLIATDLAARGIDVPEIKFIIHYHLPLRKQEFTHRNGRTARMNQGGTAYVLHWEQEKLPDFIDNLKVEKLTGELPPETTHKTTLFISGGRKDKISKGDIAGLFFKQGGLVGDELGTIELKQDCAFVSVPTEKHEELIEKLNNTKLKKRKIRVTKI
ncbi:MAG: DEAD/DEAH box helicase [Flavobacteriales bacterium]|jgi:superfamily II DNA/RNA helicase|tara:strand:- start:1578 stop:2888 length:1311 start_codon:yes stop_codon:yes gene_type:complete